MDCHNARWRNEGEVESYFSTGRTIKETTSDWELGNNVNNNIFTKRIAGKNHEQFRYTNKVKALLEQYFYFFKAK